jgi:hypothetical protein
LRTPPRSAVLIAFAVGIGQSGAVSGRTRYAEGDWFAVPLIGDGYAVGLVARANPKGVLLGYFFGSKRATIPSMRELGDLRAEHAILVQKFGHLGLKDGTWPVLGRVDGWDRASWPMPVFVRYEELTGRSFNVFYDPDNPNKLLRKERIAPGVVEQGPQDVLMGAGYAESLLTRLLAP